jgi:hypothetical protein
MANIQLGIPKDIVESEACCLQSEHRATIRQFHVLGAVALATDKLFVFAAILTLVGVLAHERPGTPKVLGPLKTS